MSADAAPQNIEIPRSHPAMSCPFVSPLSREVIGIPLVVYREAPVPAPGQTKRERDCQSATYLMIELDTGFAASEWQGNIGPVRVCASGPGADVPVYRRAPGWQAAQSRSA